jgi:hypothetical protein
LAEAEYVCSSGHPNVAQYEIRVYTSMSREFGSTNFVEDYAGAAT